jgi:hypothetical protein
MDLFFIIGLIALCFIAIGFIGYSVITKGIIDDQEREISALRDEISRIKAANTGLREVTRIVSKETGYEVREILGYIDLDKPSVIADKESAKLFEEF